MDLRGNVETRLQKLVDRPEWDALVLAGAGLKRLGYLNSVEPKRLTFEPLHYCWLDLSEMIPAPGQAALGIEILAQDERARSLAAPLNRFRSQAEVSAERSFLAAMGGGCLQPVAAIGRALHEQLTLRGIVFSTDGAKRWEDEVSGALGQYEELGILLADKLKSKGAKLTA